MTPIPTLILETLKLRRQGSIEPLEDAEQARLKELEIRLDQLSGLAIVDALSTPGTAERLRPLLR